MEKEYKRLSIDFPNDDFVFLKMACARKKLSMKEFVTLSIMKTIQDFDDEILGLLANEEIKKDSDKSISWERAAVDLGWEWND